MALHDAGADALLRQHDACYELVWTLDAAAGQRRVGVAHLRKLQEMFRAYQGCAGVGERLVLVGEFHKVGGLQQVV